ncbi:MAG: sugar phosphate nucleotidyltransferase [Candidatus Gracilibacteria bacterium]
MSSAKKPKQFQKLVSNHTMLEETWNRLSFVDKNDIYVSTNTAYEHFVRELLPDLPAENLILEPSMQDTGPCIGLATTLIAKKDPKAVIAIVYADHLVKDTKEFELKLKAAEELALTENTLNIIEVKAKYPNTNLGYVRIGRMLKETTGGVEVYEFKEFKEKPDAETAKKFLSSYSYLWNTGYYVWRADTILEEFKKHLPKTYAELQKIANGAKIEDCYPACDKISIDYGIMEKVDSSRVRIIPADLGWSDIGTFASLHEELTDKNTDNLIKGNVSTVDCEGSLIYNEDDGLIGAIGLKDIVVVRADGQTLVCKKNRSGDIKTLGALVLNNKSPINNNITSHAQSKPVKKIPKPWGHEIWFADQKEYAGKILHIKKGHRYSLQYHEHKKETQFLLNGLIKFSTGASQDSLEEIILKPGDKLDILPGTIHRAQALEDSDILEVSTNDLDDVVKLADDYGRSGKGNDFELDKKLSKE